MFRPKKIGIDLGTANTVITLVGQGIVLNEPTVVAVNAEDNTVVAVGNEALTMLGRTPDTIIASRPLKNGAIADYGVTEAMLKYFLRKVTGRFSLIRPDVFIATPAGVTSVESRAVQDATLNAGAKSVTLVPEPLAAAIGARLKVSDASGSMIINAGGGTTEVAVISLSGLVRYGSTRVAGNAIDDAITSHLRKKYNLIVGERTAEYIKVKIGMAVAEGELITMEVKGRDSVMGLPRTVEITAKEITSVIEPVLNMMLVGVKEVLEDTPPELASDIIDKGIVMSGGTSLLGNIDKYFTLHTGVPVYVVENPLFCVIDGLSQIAGDKDKFRNALIKSV